MVTDRFTVESQSLYVWLNFLIIADYFMLSRLVEIISDKLASCIRVKYVVPLYLIAQSHNAQSLEAKCLHFIAVNEQAVFKSQVY